VPVTNALGVVARADTGQGRADVSRGGVDVRVESDADDRGVRAPVTIAVHAATGDAGIESQSRRLVSSAHAGLAVFDFLGDVALRAAADPRPGLPVSVATHTQWRHAIATGTPSCVAAAREWTVVAAPSARISVPIAGASPSHPLIAYLTSSERPHVEVSGLDVQTLARQMNTETFDRDAGDTSRLRALAAADGLDGGLPEGGRFVVRVQIGPTDVWQSPRLAISAGTNAASWIVRVPSAGRSADTSSICRIASDGPRLLRGQSLVIDDETVRELTVRERVGWNSAEQLHGDAFQWTRRASATASFRTDARRPLVLAIDAHGADTPEGPQRVTIRINGSVLHEAWQGAGRLEIPVGLLRAGDNELALDVPRVVQAPSDARSLGVLVRTLRVIAAD
jgi:hypothetical protein